MRKHLFFRLIFPVLLISLLFCIYRSHANTIIVDCGGSGNYTIIQQGIDNSTNGDTVLVYPGIYFENINFNGKIITVASKYLLTGNDIYINTTIIDGNTTGNIVSFNNDENSDTMLNGFTIQNGERGIYCHETSPTLENLIVKDNYGFSLGTGLYFRGSNSVLKNSIITNNTGLSIPGVGMIHFGGGLHIWDNSNIILNNIEVSYNSSYVGGGVYLQGCTVRFTNTLIFENTATYGAGLALVRCADLQIINSTVTDNHGGLGAGILCVDNSHPELMNTILWDNIPHEVVFSSSGEPNSISLSYCDIRDGLAGIFPQNNGTIIWGFGNINEDPLFFGGDPFSYELSENSPCIDAGTPDTTGLHLPATDLAGNQRIYNGRIDIGAYEYQGYGIDEPDTSFIRKLYLFQNKPNPFSSSTTITFISADYDRIKDYTLSIYNTKGQLVKRYYGSKDDFWVKTKIVWDGTDEQGRQVAPGTYLYKLEYNGNAVVRKMVLLR